MALKNLLITGGCGFIGTNLIRYLLEESSFSGRIINVDKLTYAGNLQNLAHIQKKFSDRYLFIKADICDSGRMTDIFSEYQIDGVCHLAAESHVDRSIAGPDEFIKTNINGTFTLLEAARANMDRLVLFHHVSTDEVYGSLGKTGLFTEDSPFKPNSPYSASKASSDHLVRAYHKTYNLPVTISNCSNNYGPFQFPEKLIPLLVLNGLLEKPLPIYGDGKNVRDWLFVKDHCIALWTVMEKGGTGETYNVGGNSEFANIDLAVIVCDLLDEMAGNRSRRNLITFVKDRPGHDRRYAIDSSKLTRELGWKPEETFESGIRKTVAWYLENSDWVNSVKSGEYRKWISEHYGE